MDLRRSRGVDGARWSMEVKGGPEGVKVDLRSVTVEPEGGSNGAEGRPEGAEGRPEGVEGLPEGSFVIFEMI